MGCTTITGGLRLRQSWPKKRADYRGSQHRGFVKVNDHLQTNVPYVWAAGDVIGAHTDSQLATPVGAHDGGIVAGNALGGQQRKVDHRVIPRTIFTDPQVAVVGLTDAEANEHGSTVGAIRFQYDWCPARVRFGNRAALPRWSLTWTRSR